MPSAESIFRELNAHLDLPARRRAELLRELRADFEDLVATLVAEGLSPEAAQARAMGMLAPTEADAGALSGVHRGAYARLVAHLRPDRVWLAERVGIGTMAALAVLAPVLALARTWSISPSTLAVLGVVALLVVAHLVWQTFRIVVRDDADAESLARAGAVQAALVALTLTVGALRAVAQAYLATGAWSVSGLDLPAVTRLAIQCAETAAVTLGLTVLGVFGALALFQWYVVARSVEDELNDLLAPLLHLEQE